MRQKCNLRLGSGKFTHEYKLAAQASGLCWPNDRNIALARKDSLAGAPELVLEKDPEYKLAAQASETFSAMRFENVVGAIGSTRWRT
jgi:hypothetical protein